MPLLSGALQTMETAEYKVHPFIQSLRVIPFRIFGQTVQSSDKDTIHFFKH